MHGQAFHVTSSIPPDKLRFVGDREWLDIIARDWPTSGATRWKPHDAHTVGEASVWQFVRALASAARLHPKRFARLALRIPLSSDPAYFTSLLGALADDNPPDNVPGWEAADVDELVAIVAHVGECSDAEYVKGVCRLVTARKDVRWSDPMVERVLGHVGHPEPLPATFTVHRGGGLDGPEEPDVGTSAINCVRGAVAGAVIQFLWSRPDAFERLLPAVERLMTDEHPSVRHEALGACLPIWNRDRNRAVRLLLNGCDHTDDRILESHWIHPLIARARFSHPEEIVPLIARMARSPVEKVAERGAAWATATHIQQGLMTHLFEQCRTGTVPQRTGVADAAQEFSSVADTAATSATILAVLFDDDAAPVRHSASRVFFRDGIFDMAHTPDLADAFSRSHAFRDNPSHLLHPLTDYTGDIRTYAKALTAAADVLAGPPAAPSRSVQHRIDSSANSLSVLLLRLYEHAYGSADAALQNDCLDRWDSLLKSRVGLTTEHIRKLDD